jgi:hypothetical protein
MLIDYPPIPKGVEAFSYIQTFYVVKCPMDKIKNKKDYVAKSLVATILKINGKIANDGMRRNIFSEDFSKWNRKTACTVGTYTTTTSYSLNYMTNGYNVYLVDTATSANYYIPAIRPDLDGLAPVNPEIEKILDGTAASHPNTETTSE